MNSIILDLINKRAKAWDAAKAFLDTKRGADGMLSAEDAVAYDKMEAEVVTLGKEVERLQRQAAIDDELNKPTSVLLAGNLDKGTAGAKSPRATDEYRNAFVRSLRTRTPSHEVLDVLSIGTDSEGGYLVPDEFERQLVQKLVDINAFRSIAHVIQTANGDHKIPVVSTEGSASWADENGTVADTDTVFGQVSLSAFKLATTIKVSEELLNDSVFNIEAYIASEFARRIGNAEEAAFLAGNGTGKPTGIFNGTPDGVTAVAATTFTADELIDLFYALRAPYRKNATWILNDATIKTIRKLKTSDGQYLWQPSIVAGQPDMLLNRPLLTSAFAPIIAASAKVIAFGDFSYYWIADRQSRTIKRLNELFAANGQIGFLAAERVDGKLILAEAMKVLTMKAS